MMRNGKLSIVPDVYSYVVKVVIPTGASMYFDRMHEFYVRNGIAEHYLYRRTEEADIVHFRFSEPAYAEFFIAEFGGALISREH
jgi:hypothetical protein